MIEKYGIPAVTEIKCHENCDHQSTIHKRFNINIGGHKNFMPDPIMISFKELLSIYWNLLKK
jgi:hypothetical protein